MNILIIGGSNSVMSPGYIDVFKESLVQAGHSIDLFTNLAVGANSSIHGLDIIKGLDSIQDYEFILLEYVINDHKVANDIMYPLWKSVYEHILRILIKNKKATAKIFNIVLGRRDQKTFNRQRRLRNSISELTKHYQDFGVEFIDIDSRLKKKYETITHLYSDDAHYKTPHVTSFIGKTVANHVMKFLESPVLNLNDVDLTQIDPCYFPAILQAESEKLFNNPSFLNKRTHFENSRFNINAIELRSGEEITLENFGELIGITYTSLSKTASLLVEDNGNTFVIDTSHAWTRTKENRFMIKNFVLGWKGNNEFCATSKIKLRCLSVEERKNSNAKYEEQYNVFPNLEEDGSVFIGSLLFVC